MSKGVGGIWVARRLGASGAEFTLERPEHVCVHALVNSALQCTSLHQEKISVGVLLLLRFVNPSYRYQVLYMYAARQTMVLAAKWASQRPSARAPKWEFAGRCFDDTILKE